MRTVLSSAALLVACANAPPSQPVTPSAAPARPAPHSAEQLPVREGTCLESPELAKALRSCLAERACVPRQIDLDPPVSIGGARDFSCVAFGLAAVSWQDRRWIVLRETYLHAGTIEATVRTFERATDGSLKAYLSFAVGNPDSVCEDATQPAPAGFGTLPENVRQTLCGAEAAQ